MLIILFVIFYATTYSQRLVYSNPKYKNFKIQLHGKIKSIREISYTAIDNSSKIIKGKKKRERIHNINKYDFNMVFNRDGEITEAIEYDSLYRIILKETYLNKSEVKIYNYEYNFKNNILNKKKHDTVRNETTLNDTLISKNCIIYNNYEKVIEQNLYKNNSLNMKFLFKYDNNGNLIEIIKYNKEGKYSGREFFIYNDISKISEKQVFNFDSVLTAKNIYQYDKMGNEICFMEYRQNPIKELIHPSNINKEIDIKNTNNLDLLHKSVYKYDKNGKRIEDSYFYNGIDLTNLGIFKYNKKGLVIENINRYGKDLMYQMKTNYKYNKTNNISEQIVYSSEDNLTDKFYYDYFYDNKKNWIKQIIFKNKIPILIVEREISYYN